MAIEQLKAGALFDVYSVPGAPDIHRCPFCLSKEIQFSYIHQTSDDVSEIDTVKDNFFRVEIGFVCLECAKEFHMSLHTALGSRVFITYRAYHYDDDSSVQMPAARCPFTLVG